MRVVRLVFMALGKRKPLQDELFIPTAKLSTGPGHPFYSKLNEVLGQAQFDKQVENLCAPYWRSSLFSICAADNALCSVDTNSRSALNSLGSVASIVSCQIRRTPGEKVQTLWKNCAQNVYGSRSYHGRILAPRKSTPSVSSASACGVSFNLVVWGSRFFGQANVPASRRLVSTQIPVPSQQIIFRRVCRRLLNQNNAPCFKSSPKPLATTKLPADDN